MNYNHVVLVGRVTRDPEIRNVGSAQNVSVATFSLAVADARRDDYTHYFDCEVWGKQAETLIKYVQKGSELLVSGQLYQQRWKDKKSGAQRRHTVVRVNQFVFGRPPKQETPQPEAPPVDDDDIPF